MKTITKFKEFCFYEKVVFLVIMASTSVLVTFNRSDTSNLFRYLVLISIVGENPASHRYIWSTAGKVDNSFIKQAWIIVSNWDPEFPQLFAIEIIFQWRFF